MADKPKPPLPGQSPEPSPEPDLPDPLKPVRPKKPDLPPFAPELPDKEDPRRKEMLQKFEEDFGGYSPRGGTGTGMAVECPPQVTIEIAERPAVGILVAGQVTLHAANRQPPAGGVLTWRVLQGAAALQLPAGAHAAAFAVTGAQGGSALVELEHSYQGQTATDQCTVHVVAVAIQETPFLARAHPGAGGPLAMTLHAQGVPGPGVYAWANAAANVADWQGGPPGNVAAPTLDSGVAGSTVATVSYTAHGVTAQATVTVGLVSVAWQEGPGRALLRPAAGAPANTLTLHAQGQPAGGTYGWARPTSDIVRFAGNHVPGNPVAIDAETVDAGAGRLRVSYAWQGAQAQDDIALDVVEVVLTQGAEVAVACHVGAAPRNVVRLQARGHPVQGNYAWQITQGNAARFQGGNLPGNVDHVDMESDQAGTATVEVAYTAGPVGHQVTARATIQVHVVGVTLTQAPVGGPNPQILAIAPQVAGHAWPLQRGATLVLDAVGAPADARGTFAWFQDHGARVRFQGNVLPGNNAQATVETRAAGAAARFRVRYALLGQTAQAQALVEQVGHCSQVLWNPAVHPPVGGAAHVGPQAIAACPDEAAPQRPHGAGGGALTGLVRVAPQRALRITPVAANAHHHGGVCPVCSAAQHGQIYHWIEPDGAGNAAAAAALELRNQIHLCLQRWNGAGGNTAHRRGNVDAWAAHAPRGWHWLVGIDYDAFRLPPMWSPRDPRPKMFGVLLGQNQAGQQVKLRAISGSFPFRNTEQPNHYWSPGLPNVLSIPSATRGARNYPAYPAANFVGQTFGTCAASKLLSHALRLGLEIESMAEIWIGETAFGRQDAALQASCDGCRRYIGEMLCESGPNARTDAHAGAGGGGPHVGVPPNRGLP